MLTKWMRVGSMVGILLACGCSGGGAGGSGVAGGGIEGKWSAVSGQFSAAATAAAPTSVPRQIGRGEMGMRITFSEGMAVWAFDTPTGEKTYEGYCHIDATKDPQEIDLRQPASKDPTRTAYRIYRITGDRLEIRMGAVRPRSFSEEGLVQLDFERVK